MIEQIEKTNPISDNICFSNSIKVGKTTVNIQRAFTEEIKIEDKLFSIVLNILTEKTDK